ncbi:MAG: hypothetical protein ACFFB0_09980 [Promethearchaeota archaeon]
MQKYTLNDYLELKLENGYTSIYVNDVLFTQCKFLILNISRDEIEITEKIDSIDHAAEILDISGDLDHLIRKSLTPEEEFIGHCSNLQAWVENEYNTRILHNKLAFPLLKRLSEVGDPLAIRVFKEEVVKRFESGNINTVQFFLYNGYFDSFTIEELNIVFDYSGSKLMKNILLQLRNLLESPLNNYKIIKNLIDLILFIDLRYSSNYLFNICDNLSEKLKVQFIKIVILHLNYKEFRNYTIPYGKFYAYFEHLVDYVYENFSQIFDLFKFLESGFYSASISLDEKLSYGTSLYE